MADGGRPLPGDGVGFVLARPGWHGDAEGSERLRPKRAKLEMGAQGDGEAHARRYGYHLFLFVQLAPHLAATTQEVPDFLDRAMRHGNRRLAGRQLEVRHAAPV